MSGTLNQKKNRKIVAALLVAVICAAVAAGLVIAFLSPQRTAIYVFREDYAAGTTLTSSMLTPVQADSKVIMGGSNTNAASAFVTSENYEKIVSMGATLKMDVNKGAALIPAMLSSVANNEVEVRMDASAIAVTVPISNITGVTTSLKPESHVNVYVTYNAGGTHLLLENMRVLAVARGDNGLSGVTLELYGEEANTLINAINTGTIHFGLVNKDGYISTPTPEVENNDE